MPRYLQLRPIFIIVLVEVIHVNMGGGGPLVESCGVAEFEKPNYGNWGFGEAGKVLCKKRHLGFLLILFLILWHLRELRERERECGLRRDRDDGMTAGGWEVERGYQLTMVAPVGAGVFTEIDFGKKKVVEEI